jgi:hypothetical protein
MYTYKLAHEKLRSTHSKRIEQEVSSGLSQSAANQHELLSQTLLRVDEDEATHMENYMK